MRNPPYQQFGAAKVAPPPGAFLQATKDGETALLSAVQEVVAGAKKIVDLFRIDLGGSHDDAIAGCIALFGQRRGD